MNSHNTRQDSVETLPTVLREILAKGQVSNGQTTVTLSSHIDAQDGLALQQMVRACSAKHCLEIGLAYGISSLFICDALQRQSPDGNHTVIDPFQTTDWNGIGLANLRAAGFEHLIDFREERSEFVLPQLASEPRQFDFAFIDGWHSFDHALVEFFYVDRMLKLGGIVAFDDADWPGIRKLMRFLLTLPHYEVFNKESGTVGLSGLGKLRKRVSATEIGERLLRPEIRTPPWELGIFQRCVAFRKKANDGREMKYFRDF